MTSRIFKSTWTWRTLAYQDKVLSNAVPDYENVPVYVDEEGLHSLFRPTTRKSIDTIYIASVGLLGSEEECVENIAREFMKRGWRLIAVEEKIDWKKFTVRELLDVWKYARINGAAMNGARISSENKKARTKAAVDLIKERWKQPSNLWPTQILLEEAGISLNSVKSVLGSRKIAQINYQAVQKRKAAAIARHPRMKRANNYIDEAPDYVRR